MIARAQVGWRHGAEAALAVLMVAVLLWAGGMLDAGALPSFAWRGAAEAGVDGPRLVKMLTHDGEVGAIAWSPDGTRIAGGGGLHRAVIVWDVRSGARAMNLNAEAGGVTAVAWSPDGKYLAAGRNFVRIMPKERVSINLWDARAGALVRNIPAPFPPVSADNDVAALAWSPDSGHVAASYRNGAIVVHDAMTGAGVITIQSPIPAGKPVVYSPDGRYIVTAGARGQDRIQVYESRTGALVRGMTADDHLQQVLAYSPDGKVLASSDRGTPRITIWDAVSGQPRRVLSAPTGDVRRFAFSPDGRWLASAGPSRAALIWAVSTGQIVQRLGDEADFVSVVAFRPDGRYLASAGGDFVRLWDLSSLRSTP